MGINGNIQEKKKDLEGFEELDGFTKNISSIQEIETNDSKLKDKNYCRFEINLPKVFQFKEDSITFKYNKSAVIYIENADTIIELKGYEKYVAAIQDGVEHSMEFFSQNCSFTIKAYTLNYCTFIVSTKDEVSEAEFTQLMFDFIRKHRIFKSKIVDVSIVSKFAIVYSDLDLLEKSIFAMKKARELRLPYYTYRNDGKKYGEEEMNIVALLKKVIQTEEVIPYYQGIYDNKEKKISRYEALMRIIDKNKVVYPPAFFMDVAIKYNLYSDLSRIMISKVLDDFKDRDECININISLIDVLSDEFSDWFWEKIENYPHPENLVLEIVENEHTYKDWEEVKNFVSKAKTYKIRLAIDDFGKGYSNLMRILQVEPNLIKTDGSIVREVCFNHNSKIILQSVKFISENINAEVVAEFVENKEIQEIIDSEQIKYSQGYYFSKPLPFEEL